MYTDASIMQDGASGMPDLNIKHVRAFLAVVGERSMAKAAQRLGISRAGTADRVQRLEAVLGVKLLERSFPPDKAMTGKTKLTEAGLALMPRAIDVVRANDALFDAPAGQDPREMDRMLAVGLLELALTALRQDLSDADRVRIYNALLEC